MRQADAVVRSVRGLSARSRQRRNASAAARCTCADEAPRSSPTLTSADVPNPPNSRSASVAASVGRSTPGARNALSSRSSLNSWAPARIRSTSSPRDSVPGSGLFPQDPVQRQQGRSSLQQVSSFGELHREQSTQLVQAAAFDQVSGQGGGIPEPGPDHRDRQPNAEDAEPLEEPLPHLRRRPSPVHRCGRTDRPTATATR